MSIAVRFVMAGILLAAAAPALLAQDPPPPPDTVRDPLRARVLERMRAEDRSAVERDAARDTLAPPGDERRDAEIGRETVPQVGLPGARAMPGARPGTGQTPARAAGPVLEGLAGNLIAQELAGLDGYVITAYQGNRVVYSGDSARVTISGAGSKVNRVGEAMSADSVLVYDLERAVFCGYGTPVLSGATGAPIHADQVCYDVDGQRGTVLGARTEYTEGATWYVHAQEATPVEGRVLYSHNVAFTSCDLEVPHYHFQARQQKVVHGELLVARNVTLRFADVPVFWLPFMVQSLKTGRRSGLLAPRFSINDIASTRSGYQRRISNVGFYWAISDYMGAETALDWYSGNWTALQGSFRYRWLYQFLEGDVNFRRFWRDEGGREFTLNSRNSWRPGERTQVRLSANYASSSRFVQERSFDPRELNRNIDSDLGVNHRFDWGTLSLSGRRRQFLDQDRVQLTLPSVGLNLSPVTLLGAPATTASWYNNITWTGATNFRIDSESMDLTLPSINARDSRTTAASANSAFRLGRFSWNQTARMNERIRHEKPAVDTMPSLDREELQDVDWSSALSFQQRLIGTSTLTPSLQVSGRMIRSPESDNELISGPTRMSLGAGLRTDFYGFWPGIGPFERMRHRISPSFNYSYSPAVEASARQAAVFRSADIREQNRISLSLNQTFEAKLPVRQTDETRQRDAGTSPGTPAEAGADPERDAAAGDEARDAAAEEAADLVADPALDPDAPRDGEPRQLERGRIVTLLSLNTSAVAYDFVSRREDGIGLVTTTLTNSIRSDFLPGLNLSFTHDLFERNADDPDDRTFSPHLNAASASFSVNNHSFIVRALGALVTVVTGRERAELTMDQEEPVQEEADPEMDPEFGRGDLGIMARGRGTTMPRGVAPGSVGAWNASLNYMLRRPRPGLGESTQTVNGTISFQPTEHWGVHWQTGYSMADGQFTDHILNLRRDLHRWEANFDFVKTRTGNFSFIFHVRLRDNPDIKLDYEQRERGTGGMTRF